MRGRCVFITLPGPTYCESTQYVTLSSVYCVYWICDPSLIVFRGVYRPVSRFGSHTGSQLGIYRPVSRFEGHMEDLNGLFLRAVGVGRAAYGLSDGSSSWACYLGLVF